MGNIESYEILQKGPENVCIVTIRTEVPSIFWHGQGICVDNFVDLVNVTEIRLTHVLVVETTTCIYQVL